MVYQMPRFYVKKVYDARQKLGGHFKEYLQLPRSEGQGATALITGLEDGMQALDMDETEIASQLLLV